MFCFLQVLQHVWHCFSCIASLVGLYRNGLERWGGWHLCSVLSDFSFIAFIPHTMLLQLWLHFLPYISRRCTCMIIPTLAIHSRRGGCDCNYTRCIFMWPLSFTSCVCSCHDLKQIRGPAAITMDRGMFASVSKRKAPFTPTPSPSDHGLLPPRVQHG